MYGATIIKRNWLPGGSVYLKVAIWDNATRKGEAADHVNDFVIRREIPAGNVTEWRRRVVNGVEEIQRSDTLEWLTPAAYKANPLLVDPDTREILVQPTTVAITPQEWLDREVNDAIAGYVQRWRAGGSRKGAAVSARLDAMEDESARLEQEFRDIADDLDEKVATRT